MILFEQIGLVVGTAVVSAAINGAVLWGIVKTQLEWLRRDVDLAHGRISTLRHDFGRLAGRRQHGRDEGDET
ncbi:MAG TPA: hypothetical protein VFS77_22210 [Pyrinomonadaceae bacterium]|nr:hypothetical protein [Pyrinomonadaceae bacterium]